MTVVGGHATVGRLSNNVFSTFIAIRTNFEKKSRWTVTWQWSEVTRPSADCQTTFFWTFQAICKNFEKKSLNGHATVVGGQATVGRLSNNVFGRFKRFGKILKKVAERSRDSVGGHATVGRLSNNVCWTFQAICKNFEKKVAERSRDSGRRSSDRRPTVKQRFWDVSSDLENFEKSRWTVTRQWSEVTRPSADCQTTISRRFKQLEIFVKKVAEQSRDSGRRSRDRQPTVKQRFLDVSSDLWKFWKKSLNGHATVVGGHATVGRLSNNVFGRFKRFGKILKKVAERSRDSGRRSRDRRLTVKQRFLDVSSNLGKFWKKSLNGHATVVGGHATVGRLSNNVFWPFQAIRKFFEKSHWTVTRQWSEVRRPSADCQTTSFEVSTGVP